MTLHRPDVLIVGSGFSSSLLARALAEHGRDVLVAERGRHPRFALGESTTPLANLSLERLARRFRWHEVFDLATWGRWREHHPNLRCGLKRGFTFIHHVADGAAPGAAGYAEPRTPTMVAASPSDAVADTQWLRADLDAWLAQQAKSAGAQLLEGVTITDIEGDGAGEQIESVRAVDAEGRAILIEPGFVVDGSGARGVLARGLGLPRGPRPGVRSSLLFAHFEGVEPPHSPPAAPYPAAFSAVHHLTELGWMYELRFDDDLVSAGWLLDHNRWQRGISNADHSFGELSALAAEDSASLRGVFQSLCARYPDLRRRFARAAPTRPVEFAAGVQWRLQQAVGRNWALLPQALAFYDPMFSTGIAWSLVAVERLCDVLLHDSGSDVSARVSRLAAYQELLLSEADHIEQLIATVYEVLEDPDVLGWIIQGYFAAASFSESQQRLLDSAGNSELEQWHWQGLLGARDETTVAMVSKLADIARRLHQGLIDRAAVPDQVCEAVGPRNVAGLARAAAHPLYGVDPETVVAKAALLGLTPAEVRDRMPRLLGAIPFPIEIAAHP